MDAKHEEYMFRVFNPSSVDLIRICTVVNEKDMPTSSRKKKVFSKMPDFVKNLQQVVQ